MSLKYKEQHETRRNINQTHNPKVEGSNPSPATTSPQQLTGNDHLPYRPTPTLISTFRSGFHFWCVICGQGKSTASLWSRRLMLQGNARRCERDGRVVPGASGAIPAPAPPLLAAVGTARVGVGGRAGAKRARASEGSTRRGADRSRRPRDVDDNPSGSQVFGRVVLFGSSATFPLQH